MTGFSVSRSPESSPFPKGPRHPRHPREAGLLRVEALAYVLMFSDIDHETTIGQSREA